MFGAVCSGRPIQLATQVEPTKYVIAVPNAANVSHIAVFLLPQTEFNDANYTALVFFQLPNSQEFKLLGGLNPNKPSAIYKLNSNGANGKGQYDDIEMDDNGSNSNGDAVINIGISIEPTPQAEVQLQAEKQKMATAALVPARKTESPQTTAALANKIVSHAYNFLGSFIDPAGKVPMKAFDNWWDKFRAKLLNNPNFLDTLDV